MELGGPQSTIVRVLCWAESPGFRTAAAATATAEIEIVRNCKAASVWVANFGAQGAVWGNRCFEHVVAAVCTT